MGTDRTWTATVELCPVCHGNNIAGNRYCYGPPAARHEKCRFEFVSVVEEARLREAEAESARLRTGLRELAVVAEDEDHPDRATMGTSLVDRAVVMSDGDRAYITRLRAALRRIADRARGVLERER